MTAPAVATWRRGRRRVTVATPEGREWVYDVIGAGGRPSMAWLAGTPWAIYPGAGWEEQDDHGKPGCWTVPVFPESAAAALELGIDWPPPPGDGKVAGRLQASRVR